MGLGVGVEGAAVLLLDCPQVAVAVTKRTSRRASLQFPIRVNSFSRLESPDYADSHGGAGKQRDRLAQVLENSSACALLRNEDSVSSLQGCAQNVTRPPFSGTAAHNGAVGADNKNLFFIGECGWTACLLEIPAGVFAGAESDSDWVINLSSDHDKCGSLGDIKRIAGPDFHVCLSTLPLFNLRADVNQHSAVWLKLFQFGKQLLALAFQRSSAGP